MAIISRLIPERFISHPLLWRHNVTYALPSVDKESYVSVRLYLSAIAFDDRGLLRWGADISYGHQSKSGEVLSPPSPARSCYSETTGYGIEQYLGILRSADGNEDLVKKLTEFLIKSLNWNESWSDPTRERLPVIRFINDGTVLETTDRPGILSGPGQYTLKDAEVSISHQGDHWADIFGTLRDWKDVDWINSETGTVKSFTPLYDAGVSPEGYLPEEIKSHFCGWYLGETTDPNDPSSPIHDLFYLYSEPNTKDEVLVGYISRGRMHTTSLLKWLKRTAYSEVYRLTGACIRTPIRPTEVVEKADA